MAAINDPASDSVGSASRVPLAEAAGDPASTSIATAEPCGPRVKRIAKTILDNLPIILTFCFTFTSGDFATYFLSWCTVSVALIALAVDFIHCRHRWAAGLEAVFPKMITITFFLSYAVVLGLLYGGVLKADYVYIVKEFLTTGGLFVASLLSLIIRRPWIYALAVEAMPPEKLQEIRRTPQGMHVFQSIMNAMTVLWTVMFGVMLCINLVCTIWKYYGGSKVATSIVNTSVTLVLVMLAVRHVQPKVIQASKEKAIEQVSDNAVDRV